MYAKDGDNYSGCFESFVSNGRAKVFSLKGDGFYDLIAQDVGAFFDAAGSQVVEADMRPAHVRLLRMRLGDKVQIKELGSVEIEGVDLLKVELTPTQRIQQRNNATDNAT